MSDHTCRICRYSRKARLCLSRPDTEKQKIRRMAHPSSLCHIMSYLHISWPKVWPGLTDKQRTKTTNSHQPGIFRRQSEHIVREATLKLGQCQRPVPAMPEVPCLGLLDYMTTCELLGLLRCSAKSCPGIYGFDNRIRT